MKEFFKNLGTKLRKIPGLQKMNTVTAENDIRYRGPLSYRYLRILSWLILAFVQGYFLFLREQLMSGKDPDFAATFTIVNGLYYLAMPLFLIAVFSLILNGRDRNNFMLVFYGGMAALIAGLYFYVIEHYVVNLLIAGMGCPRSEARNLIQASIAEESGHLEFNFFIDVFLCVLLMYFINHNPKKVFTGKKRILFRSFAIFPVLYELTSNILKILAGCGKITLPLGIFPFLTTKPPLMFLMFLTLTIVLKSRERIFIRRGGTHEEFNRFLKTKVNSLQFSLIMIATIIIFSLIDKGVYQILVKTILDKQQDFGAYVRWANEISSWGFGELSTMIWLSPIMLLFSYTKRHKNAAIDVLVPLLGIILIIMVFVEFIYRFSYGMLTGVIRLDMLFE